MKFLQPFEQIRSVRRNGSLAAAPDGQVHQRPVSRIQVLKDLKLTVVENANGLENNLEVLLPTDLLIVIFFALQSMVSPWTAEGRKWIRVTHVCRRWRDASLASPGLWTYVDTSWGTSAAEFISRSGVAPLKLRVWLNYSAAYPEIQAVNQSFTQIARVRELHIHVQRIEQLVAVWAKLRSPKLSEKLEIISLHSKLPCKFPPEILMEVPSGLTHLDISLIQYPDQSSLLRQLTHLKVDYRNTSQVLLVDLLTMLGSCTLLLDFEFLHDGYMRYPTSVIAKVPLPSLRRLSLKFAQRVSINMLNYLTFPPDVSLFLVSRIRSNAAAPCIPPMLCSTYDSCQFDISPYTIHLLSTHATVTETQSTLDAHFIDRVVGTTMASSLRILQFSFGAMLPQLQILTITLSAPLPNLNPLFDDLSGSPLNLFREMQNLDSLVLVRDVMDSDELVAFAEPILHVLSRDDGTGLVFCPSLRNLTLRNFLFAQYPSENLEDTVVTCARQRSGMKARLEMVDISGCQYVESSFLDELAPFVDNILRPIASHRADFSNARKINPPRHTISASALSNSRRGTFDNPPWHTPDMTYALWAAMG